MIYEERSYQIAPAHFREFLKKFEEEGLGLVRAHLGRLVAYFTTETGKLNTVVHIWAFDDLVDRDRRRQAMWSDPEWLTYVEQVMPWIEHMETRLLKPTAFSPLQ